MTIARLAARVTACEEALGDAELQLAGAWAHEHVIIAAALKFARLRRVHGRFVLVDVVDSVGATRVRGDSVLAQRPPWTWVNNREPLTYAIAYDELEQRLLPVADTVYELTRCDQMLITDEAFLKVIEARAGAQDIARELLVARCAALLESTPTLKHLRYAWHREYDDEDTWDTRELHAAMINNCAPHVLEDAALRACVDGFLDDIRPLIGKAFPVGSGADVSAIDVSSHGIEIRQER